MTLRIMAILPAYNEDQMIAQTIENVLPFVDELVVVDDGSTDKTYQHAQKYPVTILHHRKNKGKGAAIYTGVKYFNKSDCDILFQIDSDGQHRPKFMQKFLQVLESDPTVDMVVASRFGTVDWIENMPFLRKISNLLSRFGLWILYGGFVVEDPQNGYRAYRKSATKVLDFAPKNGKKRYGFEAETILLIYARIAGLKIGTIHIPSLYFGDRESKFSLFMDTWSIPLAMLKYFFVLKPWLYRRNFK